MDHAGRALKILMAQRGLTAADVGRQMGVSKATVQRLLRAPDWPSRTLLSVSAALRVPPDAFVQGFSSCVPAPRPLPELTLTDQLQIVKSLRDGVRPGQIIASIPALRRLTLNQAYYVIARERRGRWIGGIQKGWRGRVRERQKNIWYRLIAGWDTGEIISGLQEYFSEVALANRSADTVISATRRAIHDAMRTSGPVPRLHRRLIPLALKAPHDLAKRQERLDRRARSRDKRPSA